MEKQCSKCGEIKDVSHFSVRSAVKDGLRSACRECGKVFRRVYKKSTKEEQRAYYAEHREAMLLEQKKYRANNLDRVKRREKAYKTKNKKEISEKQNKYYKEKRVIDLQFRLKTNLRTRLNGALSNSQKSGSAVSDLGCSIEEFKLYIADRFLPGMTWGNWGFGFDKWNLDHIVPLSRFDLSNREQFLKACHYTNYQPLWHFDNLAKKDRFAA